MGRGFRSELVVGLVVLVLFVLGAIFFSDIPALDKVQSLRSWQEADAPPGYPVEISAENPDGRLPTFDGEFVLLDAFARFRLPPVARLDQPLGTEAGALAYRIRPFLKMSEESGENNLGDDLTGIGGPDRVSEGAVRAVANGMVVYARDRGSGWGKVVILGHRLPDGRHVHSLSGHLDKIEVARGALVARGQEIGTIGKPGGSHPAHLHFEVYEGALIDPRSGSAQGPLNRLDPAGTILAHRPADPADLSPEPLAAYEVVQQVFKIGPDGTPGRNP